jgi:phosphatidylserine/phosphatidylglycerophosphate/cardiolipin synthase-like enzyme
MRAGALLAPAFGLTIAIGGCASLPRSIERPHSTALSDTSNTRLGRALAQLVKANPGRTGIHALDNARDAFAARVVLARAADRSLDVQYYIWHHDTSGSLLAHELWQAAERGVRVRLLLDDNDTRGADEAIAALDAHPNIEVRLFNPYANRGFRLVELATDFARLNRRMHNKSFTADNQAAIVGGRNVGDEYFGAESAVAFADLDVLAIGAVVPEVSAAFDAYWNSESAYPAASLIAAGGRLPPLEKIEDRPEAARYLEAVRATPLVRVLLSGNLPLDWAQARLVQDDPAKVRQPPERTELHLLPRLEAAMGKPTREMDLVSPYFVPTQDGTAALGTLAQSGVRVRVLTNSLAATDVSPVHAGYAKYREALLRAGVRLYELRPLVDKSEVKDKDRAAGSSDASLHAKTFALDRSRIFIGSFNFDPRSARLNTEMGIVVESGALAARLSQAFDREIPNIAYEVRLASEGGLEWIEGSARHTSEPGAGLMKRLWIGFLSILPIEWLL